LTETSSSFNFLTVQADKSIFGEHFSKFWLNLNYKDHHHV
jgi:hypothetical protein